MLCVPQPENRKRCIFRGQGEQVRSVCVDQGVDNAICGRTHLALIITHPALQVLAAALSDTDFPERTSSIASLTALYQGRLSVYLTTV